ncbi:MAG: ornithine carbamoyltransferase [Planctomycetota bacterium]|jgi:ornithine carbamoyltransferase|nr:ornithine carbamoyltransferase [Planctomycetota bacterium]
MKHLRSLFDLAINEFHEVLALAVELKRKLASGDRTELLKNRTLALIFEKSSLRTRVSFEAGMIQLGGAALYLTSDVGWRERESISDFVRVLAEYCDFLVCRAISHSTIEELASHNVIPVINGLTDQSHPCQALADFMTMQESIGSLEGKQLTFVGDGNNVARSLLNVCALGRMKFRLVGPKAYHISSKLIDRAREHAGWIDFEQCEEITPIIKDADFVYTDVWTSMGQEAESASRNAAFRPYQINASLMAKAPKHCKVMHCLPARRGLEISDDVIDSENSIVIAQAGNRMHLQKGLLVWLSRQNKITSP